ncbi:MAG: threonylcarbamoyl-AMP synthase [Immundisolibacteraceae bacterium]|nr:threonylcarbamoyl-AMP synthase [Immundisolibacteraceae bacterium]
MNQIDQAVELLREGELIGLPTETVYGLAADASNPDAVRAIFRLKGRPANHPVIIHLARVDQLGQWAEITDPRVKLIADQFWPGPLTLVLPKLAHVDEQITGGQQTIAIRIPAHPVAHKILSQFGGGLAAPSANRFGRISPTLAAHVRDEFGADLALVVDGGDCELGLESTILSLVAEPELLRPGVVTVETIEHALGEPVQLSNRLGQRASGMLERHYSPTTAALLVESADIDSLLRLPKYQHRRVGLLKISANSVSCQQLVTLPNEPLGYGQQLYNRLRELDQAQLDYIIIEQPPISSQWAAVNDRLRRATVKPG